MLIVIEGIDGAGKTTFANALAALHPYVTILHKGPPVKHVLVEYELELETYDPDAEELWILDRWHVGELIYGPLYRGESKLTPAMYRHIEMFLDSIGAMKILLHPPLDIVRERLAARGEDFLRREDVQYVADKYWSLVGDDRRWGIAQMMPDAGWTLNVAGQLAARATRLRPYPSYVGELVPDMLLVGERPSGGIGRDRPRYRAAFVPYADTSGAYLIDALETHIGADLSYGLANALQDNIGDLWKVLGNPNVVGLGAKATRELERLRIPHGSVPHPQYARRFMHHRSESYAQAIMRAAEKKEAVWPH